jgi:hypothetical protein
MMRIENIKKRQTEGDYNDPYSPIVDKGAKTSYNGAAFKEHRKS